MRLAMLRHSSRRPRVDAWVAAGKAILWVCLVLWVCVLARWDRWIGGEFAVPRGGVFLCEGFSAGLKKDLMSLTIFIDHLPK